MLGHTGSSYLDKTRNKIDPLLIDWCTAEKENNNNAVLRNAK